MLLTLIFPDYTPSLRPDYGASIYVGQLLAFFFFTAFISAMTLSTLVPFFDWLMRAQFARADLRSNVYVRIWPGLPRVELPGFSSFGLVRFAWYSFCLAGLPLSVLGVVTVAIWEPGTVSRGLFGAPHTFDAVTWVACFLLIPAQQLGAGYIASGFRIVPGEFCRETSAEAGEIAARLVLFSGLYNLGSFVLLAGWLIMQMMPDLAFIGTVLLCMVFLGAAFASYVFAGDQQTRISRRVAAKHPGAHP